MQYRKFYILYALLYHSSDQGCGVASIKDSGSNSDSTTRNRCDSMTPTPQPWFRSSCMHTCRLILKRSCISILLLPQQYGNIGDCTSPSSVVPVFIKRGLSGNDHPLSLDRLNFGAIAFHILGCMYINIYIYIF